MSYLNLVFIEKLRVRLEFKRILHSTVKSSCHADGRSQLQLGEGTSLQCVTRIGLLLVFRCCYSCMDTMTFIL